METKTNQTTLFNPTQSKEINTINLEHNQPLVEHTLGQGHRVFTSSKNECISDPGSISTTKLFTKPIVFAPNLEWAVEDQINEVIYSESLLTIFETLSMSPGGQSLRAHAFFRSGAKVQLKLTTSPFHAGKLVFFYIPPGTRSQYRDSIYSRVQFPSVYVDAGNSTTAELDIPFVAIKDFFATQNPDRFSDFGQIAVCVLNPLVIGTGGQTTINFALSLHPTQNQIALPILAHDINLQASMVAGIVTDALLSDVGSALATVASTASGVAVEHGVEKLIGADVQKVKLNDLDISKLSSAMNINNTSSMKDLNVSAPSLSNMVNGGTEHLSLLPEKTFVSHHDVHATVDDEMDIQRLAQVPSLLLIKDWSNVDEPGTVLFKTSINPMTVPSTETNTTTETATLYPTYLSHVSSPFNFWRGSIDYHFTFASTEQHKGKIIAAWIPFDTLRDSVSALQPNPTVTSLSLFPNEIFDLSLNKEFTFSVPYNTETPYRTMSTALVRQFPNGTTIDNSDQISSLGTLIVMVYNRLSNPSTVSPTIQFNVFIRAGKDYQVRALRYNQSEVNTYERIRYVQLQSLSVELESSRGGMLNAPENRVGMVNSHVSNTSFQDDDSEHNLQKLLSKYYPQVGFQFTIAENTTRRISIANLPGLLQRSPRRTSESDPRWRNLINHYRDIFAFWSGSINYFFIHNSTVNTPVLLMASHNPYNTIEINQLIPSSLENQLNDTYSSIDSETEDTANTNLSETCIYSHMSNLRVNPTIEVTAPYRSIFRRLYTVDNWIGASDAADYDECAGTLDLVYSNPSGTAIPVSVMAFQSLGSDFRFKYLIPPPSLQTRIN